MAEVNLCRELSDMCGTGQLSQVRKLLDQGADPNEVYTTGHEIYDDGMTHLMNASMWGHIEIIEELVNRGADLDARNRNGNTALLLTAWDIEEEAPERITRQLDIAKLLIRLGCSVDISSRAGTFFDILPEEMRPEIEEYIDSLFVLKPAKRD